MAKETQIINYHTSGTAQPSADNLEFGEIAVGHDNDNPRLYIRKNNNEIATFVDKVYVDNKVESSKSSYKLALNDDGVLSCIKNGTEEGFVLSENGELSLA